jgi:hypothetical protein
MFQGCGFLSESPPAHIAPFACCAPRPCGFGCLAACMLRVRLQREWVHCVHGCLAVSASWMELPPRESVVVARAVCRLIGWRFRCQQGLRGHLVSSCGYATMLSTL